VKHRHRARRLAMQGLCCLDAQGDAAMEPACEFIRGSREDPEILDLARQMLAGAWAYHPQADAQISQRSENWDLRRMGLVDRSVLRLAAWELATRQAPTAVVISEAVRLAKEFSTADSSRFVNGVLDALAHGREDHPAETV
jgi:N utilization substance protein B